MWHRRADRGITQHVWLAWRDAVVHRAHVKQAVVSALMRICHKSSAAAFQHWQEYVAATRVLSLQQEHAVRHMQTKRLQKICLYWRAFAAVKQQYKVSIQTWNSVSPCNSCFSLMAANACAMSGREPGSEPGQWQTLVHLLLTALILSHKHHSSQHTWSSSQLHITVHVQLMGCSLTGGKPMLMLHVGGYVHVCSDNPCASGSLNNK